MANILIIDDEEDIRRVLKSALKMAGHDVLDAGNGDEGLRLHETKPFDLIIVDIVMPEKEGIETILELRQNDPDVKLIAISGYGGSEPHGYLDSAKKFGVDVTLAKPFKMIELIETVKELLGESE